MSFSYLNPFPETLARVDVTASIISRNIFGIRTDAETRDIWIISNRICETLDQECLRVIRIRK